MTMQRSYDRVCALVLQYAQTTPDLPMSPSLSLRRDLSIDSLSLVSLTLRIGDEVGVDLIEAGVDLGRLDTVGDLVALFQTLQTGGHHGEPTAARG
jgi:acyl carrier protein